MSVQFDFILKSFSCIFNRFTLPQDVFTIYNLYLTFSNNIKDIFEVTRNYVREDREQSGEFLTNEGLRQGAALSPILFIMIIDDVAKEIKSKIKQIHIG